MTERTCEVILLDDSKIKYPVTTSLYGSDLFSMVASRVVLLGENQYFGLCYHHQETGLQTWLNLDAKVVDQFSKSQQNLVLWFAVRNYVNDASVLQPKTQKAYFLQTLRLLSSDRLETDVDKALTLAAVALQALEGDYISDSATGHQLDKRKLISDGTLIAKGSSLDACSRIVCQEYKDLIGMSQENAITCFLGIAQDLPQYGVSYFKVEDKSKVPYELGISRKGIGIYAFTNTLEPRQFFDWTQIVNVQFEKKKFILEADPENEQTLQARNRTLTISKRKRKNHAQGLQRIDYYTESASYSSILLQCVIDQHNFFISSEQTAKDLQLKKTSRRTSLSEPEQDMDRSHSSSISIPGNADNLRRLVSNASFVANSPQPHHVRDMNTDGHDRLDRLEQRKKQLLAEIDRKEKLLNHLKQQEQEYLITMRASTMKTHGEYIDVTPNNNSHSANDKQIHYQDHEKEDSGDGGTDVDNDDDNDDDDDSEIGSTVDQTDKRKSMWFANTHSGFGTVLAVQSEGDPSSSFLEGLDEVDEENLSEDDRTAPFVSSFSTDTLFDVLEVSYV